MAISDAQFAAWLLNDNANRCVIAELDYQYELAGVPATGTLYYSDKVYFDGSGTHPYIDCVAAVPQFSRSLGGNQFGTYSSSIGSLELDNADRLLDALLTYAIDGSAIRFKLGDVSWVPADFRLIFSALSLRASATSPDRISVQLKDTGLLLNQSIGGTIKVGGTGPNADRWRPVNFGLVHQIECKVLDQTTLTYVHSDTGYGLVLAAGSFVMTVRDRGVPVVFTNNGDGTLTLAATPAGTITADLLYVSPAPGSEWRCVSDAMRFFIGDRAGLSALGLYYGPGPTFDLRPDPAVGAWLAAGGEDYQIGISLADKRNVQDLLGDLTDSGLCFWAIRRDSKFTFGRLRPNYIAGFSITPTKILTEDLIDGGITLEHLVPAYYQFQATMSKNWSIQTDLASSLSVVERAKFLRSGLYVLQNNGVGTDYANAPQSYNKTLTQSPEIETLLSGADDSTDPALLKLWMEVRRAMSLPWLSLVSLTTGIESYDLELGDPVTVKVPHFGYDAGVDFQVIAIDINLPSKVALKLLRRDPQQATGRTTTPPDGAPFSGAAKLFIATASLIAGVATGTNTGTAPAAPIANMTATSIFIPGTASAINASPPGGGPGGGSVTSITATAPIVVTPSTIVSTGVVSIVDFVASGASHARGSVPDPGASAGTTKFLREDATFAVPPGTASPLTTKGDVYGYSTVNARIPIGSNDQVLTADSTQALGLKWAAASAGGGGLLKSQEFTSSGTFTPASGVTGVWISGSGGGGGGGSRTGALGGGGGGAGEFCEMSAVVVSGAVTVTIGAGGAGASAGATADGTAGSNTTFGSLLTLLGGKAGAGSTSFGGNGGGPRGAAGGQAAVGVLGTQESPTYFGGSSGGAGGTGTSTNGFAGGSSAGFISGASGGTAGGTQAGGGAGGASIRGLGGVGGAGGSAGTAGAANTGTGGGGGGGVTASSGAGGAGGAGWLVVFWIG